VIPLPQRQGLPVGLSLVQIPIQQVVSLLSPSNSISFFP
jgi:hypothetical protein